MSTKYLGLGLKEKIQKIEGPIFVFGASGFIGANMVEKISRVRNDFFALTHDLNHSWRLKLLDIPSDKILCCDIVSKSLVEAAFQKYKPKTIFHLAAYGSYSKQINTKRIHKTNYIGTLNILESCGDIACYVHAGTSSEYGQNAAAPSEESKLQPNSHYAVSKVASYFLTEYFGKFHSIPAIHLRFYSVYGPWEEPDRLIPKLMENIRSKKLPPLVSPEISRDFVYIDDCIEAFVDAALNVRPEIYGQSFNIATGRKTTMQELIELCQKEFHVTESPQWKSMNNRNWDLQDWYGNPEKAKKYLGWQAKINLLEGLKKTYQWQNEISYKETVLSSFERDISNREVSCVIACYKDEKAIPIMYQRLKKVLSDLKVKHEIIFVNDCSPDKTEAVIEKLCHEDDSVIGVKHSRNFGSQSAFLSGMSIATGDAVILMDGDLQDPPEMIPKLYEKWLDENDVVYGVRVKREGSLIMNACYKLFYRIFSRLSYIRMPVDAGDFSLIDRKVVKQLVALPETEQFLRGLRAWVGFRQIGVPYVRPERMFGVSTNNFRKNIAWAKKAIFSFTFLPLEFLSYFSLFITIIAFIALVGQIIAKFLMPEVPQGITTIIVLILFFGGVQLLAISVIGEYLSKIFEETKKRPKFIRVSIRRGEKLYDTAEKMEQYIHENI